MKRKLLYQTYEFDAYSKIITDVVTAVRKAGSYGKLIVTVEFKL